jgi:sigma-E factor negative regulatory protein RseB
MRSLVFAALLSGGLPPVFAEDAGVWLQRMQSANGAQTYVGTFVYERSGNFSTHGIWNAVDAQGSVTQRLLQLDGPAVEALMVDHRVHCSSGGMADSLGLTTRGFAPERLQASYDVRLIGTSRVAGRPAVVLALLPRDPYRFASELHLDRDTGLPLKSLLLGDKGQLLERLQFTMLQPMQEIDPHLLQPSADCQPAAVAPVATRGAASWRAEWMPVGFELLAVLQRPSPVSGEPVQTLLFDDGLARFSIFVEPLRGAMVADARSQLGPTVLVSRRIATADGGVMATVVGEIPLAAAERIALSMQAQPSLEQEDD